MKFLKIRDDVHTKLKDYVKSKNGVFMQEYVERVIEDSIKNNYLTMNTETLVTDLSALINISKIPNENGSISYLDMKREYQIHITSDNIDEIIGWYKGREGRYYNLVGVKTILDSSIVEEGCNEPYIEIIKIHDNGIDIVVYNKLDVNIEDLLSQSTTDDLEFGDFVNVRTQELVGMTIKTQNFSTKKIDSIETLKNDVFNKIAELCEANTTPLVIYETNDDQYLTRRIITIILNVSNLIATEGRIGAATTLIAGKKLIKLLCGHLDLELDDVFIPKVIDKFAGIDIIYHPNMDDDSIYIYRKNEIDYSGLLLAIHDAPSLDVSGALIEVGDPSMFYRKVKLTYCIPIDEFEECLQHHCRVYPFITLNPNHSKFNLEEYSLNIEYNNLKEIPNIDAYINDIAMRDLFREIVNANISTSVVLPELIIGSYFLGYLNQIKDRILEIIYENGGTENITIIVGSAMGSYFQDIADVLVSDFKDKNGFPIRSLSLWKVCEIGRISVYVDPFIKFNDRSIYIVNDFRLSFNKTITRSIVDLGKMTYNISYKVDKDIILLPIDQQNTLMI